jgi:hypothetical protein
MTTKTQFLGLTSYNTITDASATLLYDYINQVSGCSTGQNLKIMDDFSSSVSGSISSLSSSIATINQKLARPKSAVIQVTYQTTTIDQTTGIFMFRVPSELDGMNLSRAIGFVNASGSAADINVQIQNMTKYPSAGQNALSTPIVILANNISGSEGIIATNYDDVAKDNQLKIYVSTSAISGAKGLQVVLEFQYP